MSQQLSAPFMLAIFYLIVSPFQSQECGDFRVLPICTITVTLLLPSMANVMHSHKRIYYFALPNRRVVLLQIFPNIEVLQLYK